MDAYEISGRYIQFCSLADAKQKGMSLGEFSKYLAQYHRDVFAFFIRYPDMCIRYFYGE